MEARKFNSLGELLEHLREEIAAAEDNPVPGDDEVVEISDWDLRKAILKDVAKHFDYSSPEEYKQYVEFIYEFLVEAAE